MPKTAAHATSTADELVVRAARYEDAAALEDLAALDSARPLGGGHVLVGELDGRIVAAVSMHDGRAIADPFVRSDDIVGMLRLHASGKRPARARVRRPWVPRLAPARRVTA
jgi:hypothetical protein